MVEIMYGDHYKQAELAGKSVAEARGQYKDEFGIPSKAQAKLNDNWVKTKLEAETELSDDDKLSFEVKQRGKIPLFAGALLLALAMTVGSFAYGLGVGWVTLPAVARPFFVTVTPLTPVNIGNVFAGTWGNITARNLTTIVRPVNYTGDLTARVYLVNTEELARSYEHLNLRMDIAVAAANVTTERLLTLKNGHVDFGLVGWAVARNYTVRLLHGSFKTLATVESPRLVFYVEVTPRR